MRVGSGLRVSGGSRLRPRKAQKRAEQKQWERFFDAYEHTSQRFRRVSAHTHGSKSTWKARSYVAIEECGGRRRAAAKRSSGLGDCGGKACSRRFLRVSSCFWPARVKLVYLARRLFSEAPQRALIQPGVRGGAARDTASLAGFAGRLGDLLDSLEMAQPCCGSRARVLD